MKTSPRIHVINADSVCIEPYKEVPDTCSYITFVGPGQKSEFEVIHWKLVVTRDIYSKTILQLIEIILYLPQIKTCHISTYHKGNRTSTVLPV